MKQIMKLNVYVQTSYVV